MNFLVRARQETSDLPRSLLVCKERPISYVSPCRAEVRVARFALRAPLIIAPLSYAYYVMRGKKNASAVRPSGDLT